MPAGDVVADGVVHKIAHHSFDQCGVAVECGGAEVGLNV